MTKIMDAIYCLATLKGTLLLAAFLPVSTSSPLSSWQHSKESPSSFSDVDRLVSSYDKLPPTNKLSSSSSFFAPSFQSSSLLVSVPLNAKPFLSFSTQGKSNDQGQDEGDWIVDENVKHISKGGFEFPSRILRKRGGASNAMAVVDQPQPMRHRLSSFTPAKSFVRKARGSAVNGYAIRNYETSDLQHICDLIRRTGQCVRAFVDGRPAEVCRVGPTPPPRRRGRGPRNGQACRRRPNCRWVRGSCMCRRLPNVCDPPTSIEY